MLPAGKASGTEQAVGRLLGAMCAITVRDDDAETAMLASWISQVHLLHPCPDQALIEEHCDCD